VRIGPKARGKLKKAKQVKTLTKVLATGNAPRHRAPMGILGHNQAGPSSSDRILGCEPREGRLTRPGPSIDHVIEIIDNAIVTMKDVGELLDKIIETNMSQHIYAVRKE